MFIIGAVMGGIPGAFYVDFNALIRSSTSTRMNVPLDAVGILKFCSNHFIVSHILVNFLAGVQILWHC